MSDPTLLKFNSQSEVISLYDPQQFVDCNI